MSGINRPRQKPQSQSLPSQQTTFTTKSANKRHQLEMKEAAK
jgi:hypothetical protein